MVALVSPYKYQDDRKPQRGRGRANIPHRPTRQDDTTMAAPMPASFAHWAILFPGREIFLESRCSSGPFMEPPHCRKSRAVQVPLRAKMIAFWPLEF